LTPLPRKKYEKEKRMKYQTILTAYYFTLRSAAGTVYLIQVKRQGVDLFSHRHNINDNDDLTKGHFQVGYDRKRVLRTKTGNRICPNTIPVLPTGTGIYHFDIPVPINPEPDFQILVPVPA
jgi:hypothetical protein